MKRAGAFLIAGAALLAACGGGHSSVTYFPISNCGPWPMYGLRSYAIGSTGGFSGGGARAGGSFSGGSTGGRASSSGSSGSSSAGKGSSANISGGGPRGASKGGGGPGSNYSVQGGKAYVAPSASRTPSYQDEIAATSARRNIVLDYGVRPPPYRTYVLSPGVYCYQEWFPIVTEHHDRTTTTKAKA